MYSVVFISSDPAAREGWRRALERHPCTVAFHTPGPDATAAAMEPLDAIVLHVELSADWIYCQQLAQQPRHGPLIVLSAWRAPDGRYRQLAFRMGCDAFVQAPCAADQLVTTIDRLALGERRIDVAASP